MEVIRLLVYLGSFFACDTRYSIYQFDNHYFSYPTFDCLYAYVINPYLFDYEPIVSAYNLIPYCRRPDIDDQNGEFNNKSYKNAKRVSFVELKEQNVTSEQLLAWSATIDVADRYESDNGSSHEEFYNCSPPWFGSLCQYKFEFDTSNLSFGDITYLIFRHKLHVPDDVTITTCYPFLPYCYGNLSIICLDWREICDGKVHCLTGEDEEMCHELEVSECAHDEYRCHFGGQCIPLAFVYDGRTSLDCLDGTDESEKMFRRPGDDENHPCHINPAFECEERTCRLANSFSCSDGDCIHDYALPTAYNQCQSRRDTTIKYAILNSLDLIMNTNCQKLASCLFKRSLNPKLKCDITLTHFENISSDELVDKYCSSKWLVLPVEPVIYHFFQFVYLINRSFTELMEGFMPDFICFDQQKCSGLLEYAIQTEIDTKFACIRLTNMISEANIDVYTFWWVYMKNMSQYCFGIGSQQSCSHSNLFHCAHSSKCISHHRLVDGVKDCYYGEDEEYLACQLNDSRRFKCQSQSNKCVSQVTIGNTYPDCPNEEEEMTINELIRMKQPVYAAFCNGKEEIYNNDETDETYCESWPCNNAYTRCDHRWHCWNGADELNCPDTQCKYNEHACSLHHLAYPDNLMCIPITYLFEKYIYNCDESFWSRDMYFFNKTNPNLSEYISWNNTKCLTKNTICYDHSLALGTDAEICPSAENILDLRVGTIYVMDAEDTSVCSFYSFIDPRILNPYLVTFRLGFVPPRSTNQTVQKLSLMHQQKSIMPTFTREQLWYCNRGIPVLLDINSTRKCLCPPSYFGDRCQWQNQRVSLTLQLAFHSFLSRPVVFQLVVMLIDQQQNLVTDHEQITYVAARDCNKKFNIYLLYPNRPKNLSANYSVRIDAFHKITLEHYDSWYLPISFPFLPVNRLATRLFISGLHKDEHCPLSCGKQGKCLSYANNKSLYFCQCEKGYSGSLCNATDTCECSTDSRCLASSICVCPLHKFGNRCNLKHYVCRQSSNNPCQHNGTCIPSDDRINLKEFTCLCTEEYTGITCEIRSNRIDIKIDQSISTIHVHFVTAFDNQVHEKTTTFKKIPYDQHIVTIYVTQPFHIVFIELPNGTFYLVVVRETYIKSENISTEVSVDRRCSSITDLLNDTLQSYNRFRRIKYYPRLCREQSKVSCFYDEIYMCVCDLDRFANCFEFERNTSYDCQGFNDCQHEGRCFQNNQSCPSVSMCVCQDCYYGTNCQFSTEGFILSLDPILGYHIKPNVTFARQPLVIKVSVTIVMLLLVCTIISGSLSIITFHTKTSREIAFGVYLIFSSSVSIVTISILSIKLLLLILSQMAFITNRSFLTFNCKIIDGLLKILFTSGEWFNACIATERMLIIIQGTSFNKRRSKQMAKWIIIAVIILTTLTHLHDPIKRRLIDDFDANEQRTWCFVEYSSSLTIYNSFITLFHFIVPLLINLTSGLVIIVSMARVRTNINDRTSFRQNLRLQLHEHKHLLTAPCILVILGVPRLIITFFSSCMKTAREPWFYLIGYFISFIPTTLIFIMYVLPSERYKKEFRTNLRKILQKLHRIT